MTPTGTTYTFAVRAVNAFGESSSSATTTVTIVNLPKAPTGLGATAGDTQVTLNWKQSVNKNQPVTKHQLLQLAQSKLRAEDGEE